MISIANPILRGFNPDPSIVRVGDDYYVATSTFEWYPGVQIYHSRDLANWQLVARPLRRPAQLDMRGNPDSCGVWAPDLSYADGRFHLTYTDVKRYGRTTRSDRTDVSLRDFHNYWVWCDRIDGEWSDPVHVNSSGFDPALFHDDDGRSWLINMLWDHRPGHKRFAGIVIQQMCLNTGRLLGDRHNIFGGSPLGFTEGPHLYKRDGYYHILVAEGGTERNRAVVMARSRSLFGPYELHPDGPVLTARDQPNGPLARAGHGDLVETANGDPWLVYLCGRPLPASDRCILGRETAIQPMRWGEDGWLRTIDGSGRPMASVGSGGVARTLTDDRANFDDPNLPPDFQWLRTPYPDQIFSLTERPGHLRLSGRESVGSHFTQALVARRQCAWRFSAETLVDFCPANFQQSAGLIHYYNSTKFHYLHITAEDTGQPVIQILSVVPDEARPSITSPAIPIARGPVCLRLDVDHETMRFSYRMADEEAWHQVPGDRDASILSDEATLPYLPNFTGTFVGMACQDMAGTGAVADFDYFHYAERDG